MEEALSQTEATEKQKRGPKKKLNTQGLSKRSMDLETIKLLTQFKEKANKKNFGRDVRDHEILACAVKQLKPEHIIELQEQTYSEQDRLSIAHDQYMKENGKISLDQFIGKLIRGEIRL